jgi:hypothetical protein
MATLLTPFTRISNVLELSNKKFVVAGTKSDGTKGIWISDNTLIPADGVSDSSHLMLLANGLMIAVTNVVPSSGGWLRKNTRVGVAYYEPAQDQSQLEIWDLQQKTLLNMQAIKKFVQIDAIPSYNNLVGITDRDIYVLIYSQETMTFVSTKLVVNCMLFYKKNNLTGFTFQPNGDMWIKASTPDKQHGLVIRLSKSFMKSNWNVGEVCRGFTTIYVKTFAATNSQLAITFPWSYPDELFLLEIKDKTLIPSFKLNFSTVKFDHINCIDSIAMWPNGRFAVLSALDLSKISIYNKYDGLWVCEMNYRINLSYNRNIQILSDGQNGTPRLLYVERESSILKIFEVKKRKGLTFKSKHIEDNSYGIDLLTDISTTDLGTLHGAYETYKNTGKKIKISFNFGLIEINSNEFIKMLTELMNYLYNTSSPYKFKEIMEKSSKTIHRINAYNQKHGYTPEIPVFDKLNKPLKTRYVLSPEFPKNCDGYKLCNETFEKIDARFSDLREGFIKVCKNTYKYEVDQKTISAIQNKIQDKIPKFTNGTDISFDEKDSEFKSLYRVWLDEKKSRNNVLYNGLNKFKILRAKGYDVGGLSKDFFDNAISEIPKYLRSNGTVSWIPRSGTPSRRISRSKHISRSRHISQKNGTAFKRLTMYLRRRTEQVHPLPLNSQDQDQKIMTYTFIGELLAFGFINNIQIGIHFARSILQKILKPNIFDIEYMYFGMQDIPESKPYVLSLLKIDDQFADAKSVFGIDSDLDSNSPVFASEIRKTILDYVLEAFELKDNPYLDAFISGFNNILSERLLRIIGVHISNIDYILSRKEVDPKLLVNKIEGHNWNNEIINTPEWQVMKSAIKDSNMFYSYIAEDQDDEVLTKYKAPTGHALFLGNLLKFWTGLNQYSDSFNYNILIHTNAKHFNSLELGLVYTLNKVKLLGRLVRRDSHILTFEKNGVQYNYTALNDTPFFEYGKTFQSQTCSNTLKVFLGIGGDVTETKFVCTLVRAITYGTGFDMQ